MPSWLCPCPVGSLSLMVYLSLVAGTCLLLLGAGVLVDTTVAIARRTRISLLVLAAVVVGLSSTELYLSLSTALGGRGDMSIGNVLGSNLCNNMLVVGVAALICSFRIRSDNLRRDIPLSFAATLLVMLLCMDSLFGGDSNGLSRTDGVALLLAYAVYVSCIVAWTRRGGARGQEAGEAQAATFFTGKPLKLLVPAAMASLAVLLVGGDMMLDAAVEIAFSLDIPEKVIAITVMSIGKTLPEIATCSIAAWKRVPEVALANVFGENVYNMLVILGLAAVVRPIEAHDVDVADFGMLLLAAALTVFFGFISHRRRFGRVEGSVLLIAYFSYIIWLFV